ncbi:hypothetical protein EYF80_058640 [Liparis tanakae]|uniref:Uncharacterized protein n=1 Tax=Liparis tanakae TaxID=230148 RepID=A0A4Z2EQT8_9TELE|nr:hypothetical protein EYF80_058640 [Liparis tanakae]
MSTPSMKIWPSDASMMRNSASVREDLPAPVRPTIPTLRATMLVSTSEDILTSQVREEVSCTWGQEQDKREVNRLQY